MNFHTTGINRFQEFLSGYLEGILFTGTTENEVPLDDYFSLGNFSANLVVKCAADANDFFIEYGGLIERMIENIPGYNWRNAGHDLNYCRNGHGTGFWDRPNSGDADTQEIACKLSDAARELGEFHVVNTNNVTMACIEAM